MGGGAIPDIMKHPEAVKLVVDHLHYPEYFLPFIGVAKLLGAIVLLIPGLPRLKEWVYAGFCYDLIGAVYSSMSVGDPPAAWAPVGIGFIILFTSYILHQKRRKAALAGKSV
jgi:uncharacterized membrane protein YphA (DoxX/SURF4 family)